MHTHKCKVKVVRETEVCRSEKPVHFFAWPVQRNPQIHPVTAMKDEFHRWLPTKKKIVARQHGKTPLLHGLEY